VALALGSALTACEAKVLGFDSTFDDKPPPAPAEGQLDSGTDAMPGVSAPDLTDQTGGKAPDEIIDETCGGGSAQATRAPVYMFINLDASGSMLSNSKWTSAKNALTSFIQSLRAAADPSVGIALQIFSDVNDNVGTGDYPPAIPASEVQFVDGAHADVLLARLATTPREGGGTPIKKTMTGVYTKLQAMKVAPSGPADTTFLDEWQRQRGVLKPYGKRVAVLVGDGKPSGGVTEANESLQLATDNLSQFGILTFAIGIGPNAGDSGYDPRFMGQLAQRGGTAAAGCKVETINPAEMCHFQVDPATSQPSQVSDALTAAVNKIRTVAAGCEFDIVATPGTTVDPLRVNVFVQGADGTDVLVPKNRTEGWFYDDDANPKKIFVAGRKCDEIKANPNVRIRVVLGCKTKAN
jgi:hypothetical protein